jgi:sulfate transport system ATP-binding protein
VLLLDEPFGALDAKVRDDLRRWLRRMHDEVHVTTVLVTHDQEEALDVADRIAVLNAGRIEQVGSPDELYEQPANPFVMSFLGSVSRLNGEIARPHDLRIERDRQRAVAEAERLGVRVTEARVERLVRLGFEARVELSHTHTGDQFFAQLTRAEASALGLSVGDVVWVLPTRTLGTEQSALPGEEEFPALAV